MILRMSGAHLSNSIIQFEIVVKGTTTRKGPSLPLLSIRWQKSDIV